MLTLRKNAHAQINAVTGEVLTTLSYAEIANYASGIDAAQFPFFCAATGELASGIGYVILGSIRDFLRYRIVHRWCRTRAWQE